MCQAYWDPHFWTFDGNHYSYHGTSEYAMAQDGWTNNPQYAVNSEFIPCFGAACVGPSSFKDSNGTVIQMGTFGMDLPELSKILVNGVEYEIPDEVPRLVKEGEKNHSVLAWRNDDYGCIRLLGSSKIAVEKCGRRLSIWASPEFYGKLYGLCGYFDGNHSNDFVKRDRTVSTLNYYSPGEDFGDSWETTYDKGDVLTETPWVATTGMQISEARNCTLEEEVQSKLRSECNQTVMESGSQLEMISVLTDSCLSDVCYIHRSTFGNTSAVTDWLHQVQTSVEGMSGVQNKTTYIDVLPNDFGQGVVTTTTTEVTKPVPLEPPVNKDIHRKSKKLVLQVVMNVNMG